MRTRHLLLAPDEGGGAGGLGGEGTPPAGGTPPADTPPAGGESVGPEWVKGWEGVEADLLSDPSLKAIQSPAALLKSYVHSQRHMGRDKTVLPGKNSTKEEVDQFWQKVGVPLEEAKYGEGFKYDKEKSVFDEAIHKEFVKTAHGLRVLPDQANKMYEFFNTQSKASSDRAAQESATATQNQLNELQAKLGPEAYNVKLTKATAFVKENAPPAFLEFLGKTGLGKNAVVVEALMQMADKFNSEDPIMPGSDGQVMTVDDLNRSINSMMGDMKGPYHNPSHPDHKRTVDEMLTLQTKLDKARQRG